MCRMKGMGCSLSDHHVILCKVRLVGAWIKRREVVVGARKIKSEKMRKHQYRENKVEHMWEQVKRAIVESA